jgi:2-succinyl-5-enolpyruvyl-6-hydroxy-3-cyclohexene-1-carboxylate synthase
MTRPTPRTDADSAPTANTLWARAIVDELARCGLRHVCISPGSRSTPLVAQFASHPDIEDHSIIDERSSAFVALGLAQASGQPVALVCTSGTAAANYLPAVCEASRAGVPLLVLTADRPAELHDCGASQAMSQRRLYGDHVRWFHQLAQPEASADKLRYARSTACRAYFRATSPDPGPVHLNAPFRKPLEPIAVAADHRDAVPQGLLDASPLAVGGRDDGRPFITQARAPHRATAATVERFAERVAGAEQPLVLAGADPRGGDYAAELEAFARRVGAPILAEPTSGLRHRAGRAETVLTTADFLLESSLYERLGSPDLVIRAGRAPLLWSSQEFVRQLGGVEQIIVSSNPELADPDHLVSWQIVADEADFFAAAASAAPAPKSDARWLATHQRAEAAAHRALGAALADVDTLCAARLWDELGALLDDGGGLFVSNSMPIRDLDTFMCRCAAAVDVYFNRGVNGIDGVVSTGLGVALGRGGSAQPGPMVVVTGDVALRHDVGALTLADQLGVDATIVVIDNDGGGIFEYLPIARIDGLHERHFATSSRGPLSQAASGACELFEPADWTAFRQTFRQSLGAGGTQIIRVATDRRADKELRESLRRRVTAQVDDAMCSIVGPRDDTSPPTDAVPPAIRHIE